MLIAVRPATELPRLRADRLWDSIHESAAIGATADGGLCRLALTAEDGLARRRFMEWSEAAGCVATVDQIGNIFCRRIGCEPALPAVAIGSHLDTQISAGRYDGVLGVMAGLEIARALNDAGIGTRRSIDVVSWTNEEGARFPLPMMGSAVFAGQLGLEEALAATDADGTSVREALAEIGFVGEEPVGSRALDSYFELHIEQGPLLDAAGIDVGVVDGAVPSRAFSVKLRGETAHAGATPMELRRNALAAGGRVIAAVDAIGRGHGWDGRSTTTRMRVWPNLTGIVPSEVDLAVDMRHSSAPELGRMVTELHDACSEVTEETRVDIDIQPAYSFGGFSFDRACVALVDQAARELGASRRRMLSQAGHDAYNLALVSPTAMIFCPCRDGRTHNPSEEVDEARAWPSVETLMRAVVARADR
jgi:N-carbamoyl-L-amino-acid hydrolase